jgi:hypothetical protein
VGRRLRDYGRLGLVAVRAAARVDLGAGLSRRADTTSRGLPAATAGFLSLDI